MQLDDISSLDPGAKKTGPDPGRRKVHAHGHGHGHHGHSHGHHGHGHSHHGHSHGGHGHSERSRKFLWALILNFSFSIIEFVGGIYTNSMAILSDAVHDLGDTIALAIGYFLEVKSNKGDDKIFSYGYRRLSLLSAIITGLILVIGSLFIIFKSVERLFNPAPVNAPVMILFALFGVIVNGWALFSMWGGSSLNEKIWRWHFIEDFSGWVVVLVGAIVIYFWNFHYLDPILALGLSVWVCYNVIKNLRVSLKIFLQGTPPEIEIELVKNDLLAIQGVKAIHHVHFWSLDGESHIFTSHIVISDKLNREEVSKLKTEVKKRLSEKWRIFEATLEIEFEGEHCLDPKHNDH